MRLIPASIAAKLTIWLWGIYAIWQGVWIVLGGDQRWESPSFSVLRLVPKPTLTWGDALIVLGALLIGASLFRLFWIKAFACLGIATWSICFAFGALAASERNPRMASTGGPTYVCIAAAVLILVFVDERRPRPLHTANDDHP